MFALLKKVHVYILCNIFHVLSFIYVDIQTSIFPNERVFISEADNPQADNASICSTFCQYTESLRIRTLRRQGTIKIN